MDRTAKIATKLARRQTADNKTVILWSDGVITFAFGAAIKGVGKSREPWAIEADLKAGWAFMGEACLFEGAEVGAAINGIRKAFRATYLGHAGFKGGEHAAHYRALMVDAVDAASVE